MNGDSGQMYLFVFKLVIYSKIYLFIHSFIVRSTLYSTSNIIYCWKTEWLYWGDINHYHRWWGQQHLSLMYVITIVIRKEYGWRGIQKSMLKGEV